MRKLRAWLRRLAGTFSPARSSREFAEELESHLQLEIEHNMRSGMTPGDARRRAVLKFGGIEQAKQHYRDQIGLPVLEMFVQDVRGGLRMMRRTPAFSVIAI